ncbi:DUF2840 domain-containing protein [Phenylobacterium sp. VNQ135]|uniref:DUF2840 domain-containing protein n=1 Tax=Phenylobacterium sp. VNQ135 TaxID=3400922 RepID=UPI003C0538BA
MRAKTPPENAGAAPSDPTTWVELVWYEKRIERWIRFGTVREERLLDRRRRLVGFRPGDVFAFVRWQANDRGTVASRLDILQAVAPGARCSTVPGVEAGGEPLLRLSGWPTVQRALAAIDAVEQLGIDPTCVAPDHWRQVHNRLSAGAAPEPYSLARHRAWRLRDAVGA